MKPFVTTALTFAALSFAPLAVLEAAGGAEAADKPNIVFVFADDLGINDLGCYGRADHRTPNLDRLASQGMRFTCAYTAQPICSPSRAAVMTGKWPARLNLTNFLPGRPDAPSQRLLQPRIEGQLPLEDVTIAELLRDAGYATGQFGKWHLGGASGPAPLRSAAPDAAAEIELQFDSFGKIQDSTASHPPFSKSSLRDGPNRRRVALPSRLAIA